MRKLLKQSLPLVVGTHSVDRQRSVAAPAPQKDPVRRNVLKHTAVWRQTAGLPFRDRKQGVCRTRRFFLSTITRAAFFLFSCCRWVTRGIKRYERHSRHLTRISALLFRSSPLFVRSMGAHSCVRAVHVMTSGAGFSAPVECPKCAVVPLLRLGVSGLRR